MNAVAASLGTQHDDAATDEIPPPTRTAAEGGGSLFPAAKPVAPAVVPTSMSAPRTETAYEWLQRSRRQSARPGAAPRDPSEGAWRFLRGNTGVAFVDEALRHRQPNSSSSDRLLPVMDVRGDASSGKTWTLLTLAARFVAATRPSLFAGASTDAAGRLDALPEAIVLDSTHDVTTSKLAYVVRSTLLLDSPSSCQAPDDFHKDMESCLGRLHVATVSNVLDWIPVLETLRIRLVERYSEHPTLLLWDGFLSEEPFRRLQHEAPRMDVIRQLVRLLQDCPAVCLVSSTASSGGSGARGRRSDWERHVTHRIRLERPSPAAHGQERTEYYAATAAGSRVPFSISLAGILS